MIRRLFSLVWAVAGRSKKIQDLVAMVWPAARTTAVVVATPAPASAPAPAAEAAPPLVVSVVEPVVQVVEAVAASALVAEAVSAPDPVLAEAVVAELPDSLRPLGSKETMDGSVWVPRILWALEFAKQRGLGPQSASDISRVLGEHSGLNVPSPNVARAFRDRKEQGASYWKEVDGQKYEISRAGSAALRKQLRSQDN